MRVHVDLHCEQAILDGPGRPIMEVDAAWFACLFAPALKTGTIGMTIGLRCASFNTSIPRPSHSKTNNGGHIGCTARSLRPQKNGAARAPFFLLARPDGLEPPTTWFEEVTVEIRPNRNSKLDGPLSP
jgi:hypothetical protein